MKTPVTKIWKQLERETALKPDRFERVYRALGSTAIGIRAGYLPHEKVLELLIEVPEGWMADKVIPEWSGMGHEVIALKLPPRTLAHHLRLFLVSVEHREIFISVCDDLVEGLEGISDSSDRVKEIEICLSRWRRFFERSGPGGLSVNAQQGLFAELTWLKRLFDKGIDHLASIMAWKGCEKGYHDFDFVGHVVEVKSTRTKEPRSIIISNEQQLNDHGLLSLHLYVLTILETEGGGTTLLEQIETLRESIIGSPTAMALLKKKLISAGYLDRNAELYDRQFVIRSEDIFQVIDGFPRIIELPPGVGDLQYKVLLGACEPFKIDLDNYFSEIQER